MLLLYFRLVFHLLSPCLLHDLYLLQGSGFTSHLPRSKMWVNLVLLLDFPTVSMIYKRFIVPLFLLRCACFSELVNCDISKTVNIYCKHQWYFLAFLYCTLPIITLSVIIYYCNYFYTNFKIHMQVLTRTWLCTHLCILLCDKCIHKI